MYCFIHAKVADSTLDLSLYKHSVTRWGIFGKNPDYAARSTFPTCSVGELTADTGV